MLTEGFPGQRVLVLPRPLVADASRRAPTSRLLVTDAGTFPHAVEHALRRRNGAPEAVVIICSAGRGWCEIGSEVMLVPAGSALVIPPRVPHFYRADRAEPWTIWWVHVTGDDVEALLAPLGGDHVVAIRDLYRAVAAVEGIVGLMEHDESEVTLISAAGVAWGLLTQLAADRVSGRQRQTEPIRAAQDHLREHLDAAVSVPELARRANLSTSHFSALFRRSCGLGVLDYVRRLRMTRARELLITTDSSVKDIARSVGYADPLYFSRQFRLVHRCSPTEFRRSGQRELV